jgi:hypothetical protein
MPKFTKQHYEMIADVLQNCKLHKDCEDIDEWHNGFASATHSIQGKFEKVFQQDNPNFKPEKFRDRVNGL